MLIVWTIFFLFIVTSVAFKYPSMFFLIPNSVWLPPFIFRNSVFNSFSPVNTFLVVNVQKRNVLRFLLTASSIIWITQNVLNDLRQLHTGHKREPQNHVWCNFATFLISCNQILAIIFTLSAFRYLSSLVSRHINILFFLANHLLLFRSFGRSYHLTFSFL